MFIDPFILLPTLYTQFHLMHLGCCFLFVCIKWLMANLLFLLLLSHQLYSNFLPPLFLFIFANISASVTLGGWIEKWTHKGDLYVQTVMFSAFIFPLLHIDKFKEGIMAHIDHTRLKTICLHPIA
jgi:hypothetical protein